MYIDAVIERDKNKILVVERDKTGQRSIVEHKTKYVVYWPSQKGKTPNIYGVMCDKYQTSNLKEFNREVSLLPKHALHENDINPIFRCLYNNYKDEPLYDLHVAFFDIETDFDSKVGYSSTEEAFSRINAVTVYLSWLKKNITLVLKPSGMNDELAEEIVSKFEDTMLCEDEKQLLEMFLDLIEDADILSGWNSEGYDIPYTHNRIVQVLGKEETKRLCLFGKYPKKREYVSYGRQATTYDLVGRIHLDYLQLYRKNTYHEMHTYRLDFVGEYEVGEKKIPYEGSLDRLYNEDFEKFIAYNRQDVLLLVKIDEKNKFIELSNTLAHENCVLLGTTLGAVALIDQAIVNEAHELGMVIPSRNRDIDNSNKLENDDESFDETFGNSVVGGYVAVPKEGMHEWIGGVDINSLYPSDIRALNMSPETIFGHIRPELTNKLVESKLKAAKGSFAEAWNNTFSTLEYHLVLNKDITPITVDFEDGSNSTISAFELYDLIFNSGKKLILSANGTIFSYEKVGIIPGLLARWYSERKQLQAEMKDFSDLSSGGVSISEDLANEIQNRLAKLG